MVQVEMENSKASSNLKRPDESLSSAVEDWLGSLAGESVSCVGVLCVINMYVYTCFHFGVQMAWWWWVDAIFPPPIHSFHCCLYPVLIFKV